MHVAPGFLIEDQVTPGLDEAGHHLHELYISKCCAVRQRDGLRGAEHISRRKAALEQAACATGCDDRGLGSKGHDSIFGKVVEYGSGYSAVRVLNKVDKVRDTAIIPLLAEGYENVVVTSAKTRTGLDVLQHMIMKMCGEIYSIRRYRIPPDRHEMIALVNKFGLIEEEEYDDDAYYVVKAGVPQRFEYKLTPFLI